MTRIEKIIGKHFSAVKSILDTESNPVIAEQKIVHNYTDRFDVSVKQAQAIRGWYYGWSLKKMRKVFGGEWWK